MDEKQSKRDLAHRKAVALRYDTERDDAPRMIAKGRGHRADQIVKAAREHGIAIHEDPDLIAVLSALELNSAIPTELYQAVAEVLAFVYRMNGRLDGLSR